MTMKVKLKKSNGYQNNLLISEKKTFHVNISLNCFIIGYASSNKWSLIVLSGNHHFKIIKYENLSRIFFSSLHLHKSKNLFKWMWGLFFHTEYAYYELLWFLHLPKSFRNHNAQFEIYRTILIWLIQRLVLSVLWT